MVLNDETAAKVSALVSIPVTYVEYNGVWWDDVCFLIGHMDDQGNWVYGVALYVTQEFKLKRVQRIRLSRSTLYRKYPIETITIPIYKP